MKKYLLLILSLAYLLSAYSQDTTIQIKSSIQFPFKLTYKKLEDITNASLTGIIYRDSSHTDNNNDQLKCTVVKNGKITISPTQNNVLRIDVPLKVWAEKGIGSLGVYAYQTTTFQLIMSFQLVYNITPDWNLKTKTIKNGYTWIQKPSLSVGAVQIPITSIIEKILDDKQQSYGEIIDEQISKNISIKKDVLVMWNQLKLPQLVSEEYKTWMKITPIQIEATPFIQDKTAINSIFKINILSETFIGTAPPSSPATVTIPNLRYIKAIPNEFELYTTINIPYSEATEISKKKFVNQEFEFQEGKYKVTLTDILIYEKQSKLVIEADMIGSYNGKIFIQGFPYYNDSLKIVKLRDLEFDMKTKNLLFKTANWLFNGKIERKLQENFEIPTQESMEMSRVSTNKAFNQTRNGVKFSGNISVMKPQSIEILAKQMTLIILSKGNLKVEL